MLTKSCWLMVATNLWKSVCGSLRTNVTLKRKYLKTIILSCFRFYLVFFFQNYKSPNFLGIFYTKLTEEDILSTNKVLCPSGENWKSFVRWRKSNGNLYSCRIYRIVHLHLFYWKKSLLNVTCWLSVWERISWRYNWAQLLPVSDISNILISRAGIGILPLLVKAL